MPINGPGVITFVPTVPEIMPENRDDVYYIEADVY